MIIFDINKEEATVEVHKNLINFCVYLKDKIESDILVTSDVHDDICLLREQGIIWSSMFPEANKEGVCHLYEKMAVKKGIPVIDILN